MIVLALYSVRKAVEGPVAPNVTECIYNGGDELIAIRAFLYAPRVAYIPREEGPVISSQTE